METEQEIFRRGFTCGRPVWQPCRKWYGFDHLTLLYETDEDDDPHTWQVDAQAFPKGEVSGSNAFHDMWCKQHPDRTMRRLTQYSFDNADALVVLHHEKMNGE